MSDLARAQLPLAQVEQPDGDYHATRAQYNFQQSFDLNFELAKLNTLTLLDAREGSMEELGKVGRQLPPKQLNEMHPAMPKPFDQPLTAAQAQYVVDQHEERARLQEAISRGPRGLTGFGAEITGTISAHITDPYEFALNYGLGRLMLPLAGMAAASGTKYGAFLGRAFGTPAASTARQAFTRNVTEGFIQAATLEPFVAHAETQELHDYTAMDALTNISLGTFAFAGLAYGMGKLSATVSRMKQKGSAARIAMSQAMQGKRFDFKLFLDELNKSTNTPYEYVKFSSPEGQTFFVANNKVADGFSDDMPIMFDFTGDGLQVTSNPHVANGVAGDGTIHIVEIDSSARILDLDEAIPDDVRVLLTEILGEDIPQGSTLNSVNKMFELVHEGKLPESALRDFNMNLKEMGYDGTVHNGTKHLGLDHVPHNALTIFDRGKVRIKETMLANSKMVPKVIRAKAQEMADAAHSVESDIDYDAKITEDLNHLMENNIDDSLEVLEAKLSEYDEAVTLMEEAHAKNPELIEKDRVEEIKDYRDLEAKQEREMDAAKVAADCFSPRG